MSAPTFILVHGAFCNATVWRGVQRDLDRRSLPHIAVDLPGHGVHARVPEGYLGAQSPELLATEPSGIAGIGTADDVAAVAAVLRSARVQGPTILVGASRGGLTLTAVANRYPELIDRLVYVGAWCCISGGPDTYESSAEYSTSELGALAGLACADPAVIGALRLNWRTSDPAHLRALQSAILHDGTRAELQSYLHAQDPDESITVDTDLVVGEASTWGTVPRSYVVTTQDRAMPPALQQRFITESDAAVPANPTDVHRLDSSHVGFQIRPAPFVDILERLATSHTVP